MSKSTVKSVRRELEKAKEKQEKRNQKLNALKEEIAESSNAIKELEKRFDELVIEETKNQVAREWLVKGKMSSEQIRKQLEIGRGLHEKIDVLSLDADDIINAVEAVMSQKRRQTPGESETQKVTIVDNFLKESDESGNNKGDGV
jgi:phage terminase large subunit-like protein